MDAQRNTVYSLAAALAFIAMLLTLFMRRHQFIQRGREASTSFVYVMAVYVIIAVALACTSTAFFTNIVIVLKIKESVGLLHKQGRGLVSGCGTMVCCGVRFDIATSN